MRELDWQRIPSRIVPPPHQHLPRNTQTPTWVIPLFGTQYTACQALEPDTSIFHCFDQKYPQACQCMSEYIVTLWDCTSNSQFIQYLPNKINFKGRQIFRFFGQMVERYDKQKIFRLEERYLRPRWEAVA